MKASEGAEIKKILSVGRFELHFVAGTCRSWLWSNTGVNQDGNKYWKLVTKLFVVGIVCNKG